MSAQVFVLWVAVVLAARTVLQYGCSESLVLHVRGFAQWIDALLVVRLLNFLRKALCSRSLFYNMFEMKLSHCLCEACVMVVLLHFLCKGLCGGLLPCNLAVVKLSCCLCEACTAVMLLFFCTRPWVKFQTSSSASHMDKGYSTCR